MLVLISGSVSGFGFALWFLGLAIVLVLFKCSGLSLASGLRILYNRSSCLSRAKSS